MNSILYPTVDLQPYDFVIVGELHGIRENCDIIFHFLSEMLKQHHEICLALEWEISEDEVERIQNFIEGHTQQVFETNPQFFSDSDNRAMSSHISLLKKIRDIVRSSSQRVRLLAFGNTSTDYEHDMANNLITFKNAHTLPTLVVTGVTHGQIANNPTLTKILSQHYRVTNFFITYITGTVIIDGEIYNVSDAGSQQDETRLSYEHNITVAVANPDTPIIETF